MDTKTTTREKHCKVGRGEYGDLWVTVKIEDRADFARLSICGVEGPKRNGDAIGSSGQCTEATDRLLTYSENWDVAKAAMLRAIWERWHLNDMRAGCEHQRDAWDTAEQLEVVTYGLTTEAYQMRKAAIAYAAKQAALGGPVELSKQSQALILLEDWYADRFAPPNADDVLSGCFEVKKRETKPANWVRPTEHPRGLLGKPCETCGYNFGSAWCREELPAEVLEWFDSLQETPGYPWAH